MAGVCVLSALSDVCALVTPPRFAVGRVGVSIARVYAKGKMPIFNADEEEELTRIMNEAYAEKEAEEEEDWDAGGFDFGDNTLGGGGDSGSKGQRKGSKKAGNRPSSKWRSSKGSSDSGSSSSSSGSGAFEEADTYTPVQSANKKKNAVASLYADDSLEFDYGDLEAAMREEQAAAIYSGGPMGSKNSRMVFMQEELKSGDQLPPGVWASVFNSAGEASSFTCVAKVADVVVLVADPRRGNDEFRLLMSELNKVPKATLGVETVAMNCDDWNDHRNYLKKNSVTFSLLADPKKEFMSQLKCTGQNRLSMALVLLEASSSRVLKIWYENDWDTFNTKDLIVDEMTALRKDPRGYMESQIGIQ